MLPKTVSAMVTVLQMSTLTFLYGSIMCLCFADDRQGTCEFLPAMPPKTVSGMVTAPQMSMMITMVPNGSAAVDCMRETGLISRKTWGHISCTPWANMHFIIEHVMDQPTKHIANALAHVWEMDHMAERWNVVQNKR